MAAVERSKGRSLIRWGLLAIAAVAVVIAGVAFNPLALLPGSDEGDDTAGVPAVRDRSEIGVSDLSRTIEAEGELRFADQREVSAERSGTLTAIIADGLPVESSTVLFTIGGEPTVALLGDVPAWRSMTVDDVGVDVAQLETNLVALGYDPEGALTVDETFTSYTATVVQRWQADLGVDETGVVDLASVVFVPADAAVSAVSAASGGNVGIGSPLLTVASTNRELAFPVETAVLDTITVGATVESQLPDRSTATATVVELGPTGDGGWEALAELSTDGGGEAAGLPEGDAVPVTVSWDEGIAAEVLTVRANALVRLDSGDYAVEVVRGNNTTEFVAVEIGAISGSTVEIITDLDVGTVIISS